jgi:hypothetical protein
MPYSWGGIRRRISTVRRRVASYAASRRRSYSVAPARTSYRSRITAGYRRVSQSYGVARRVRGRFGYLRRRY